MDINQAIERRFGLPTEIGKTVAPNSTLESILDHRSVREFSNQPIDSDLMQTLFAAAFSAPSKSDLQQARAIWIKDPEVKRMIAELSPNLQAWVADAPEFVIWCGDNTLCHELAKVHEHPYVNNHLDQFMNPAVDAGIAMATFICAAEAVGLRCCPVSSIRDTPTELANILKLPKFVFPVAGLVIGYPSDSNPGLISMRLPPAVTVMENEYSRDSAAILAAVKDYSQRRESVKKTAPSEQRETKLFGTAPEYGWDEDKSRQYALKARADWGDFIKAQGFLLE